MDGIGRSDYIIPPPPPPQQNRANLRKRLPNSPPAYGYPERVDDGRQFLMNKDDHMNITDFNRSDERDGFYCGDAIMFYPDASECNGGVQRTSKREKTKSKPEAPAIPATPATENIQPADKKPHKCIQCGAGFKQRSHLKAHIRTHTGEKPFGCNVCGKMFARIDSAVRHMKTHTPKEAKKAGTEQPMTFKTPIESIPPPQFNPLLKSLPPSFTTPVKTKSKKKKKSKSEKHRHRSRRAGRHRCQNCGQAFRQVCHLRVHVRIHTGEKPFSCQVCGKTFGRKFSAERHLKTHGDPSKLAAMIIENPTLPPPPMISEQVPSTSGSMGELLPKLDKMESLDKPFRCHLCTAAFSQRSHLRNHHMTHSGEKPYSCETCSKTFSRKYSLLRHKRMHTGEKRFKCDFCGNLYSHRFHLRDHMRTHTGEKPFNCPVCEKAFSRKDLAVRHLRTHTDSAAELFDFPEEPE